MNKREHLESLINEKQRELQKMREREIDNAFASRLRSAFDALVAKGFTKEQAFSIIMSVLKGA